MDSKHDDTFMGILREEKNIASFLDAFFGFLYRCTDFYTESGPNTRLGFPPGIAEQMVISILQKWQREKKKAEESMQCEEVPPPAAEEVTIISDNIAKDVSGTCKDSLSKSVKKDPTPKPSEKKERSIFEDCYNGASYDNYRWSQTISELDVVVILPEEARSSKDVRVRLTNEELEVAVKKGDEEQTIVKGRFSFKIKSSESYWCLEPGKHISLHLEKTSERWWESLLDSEPPIELRKIDSTKYLEDMDESEQMKVEELVWNQKRKLLGQSTSDQIRMEQMLQKAWNADGSPFKGTEYDPSVVKFN